jgi:hypothetical protein
MMTSVRKAIRKIGRHGGGVTIGLLVLMANGCGSKSPTSPSGAGTISVAIGFQPATQGDTYTASLNGQTFSAYSAFLVQLSPGTYKLTGSFVGSGIAIGFGGGVTTGKGGVRSGSVRSLSGSEPETDQCAAYYFYSPALLGTGPKVKQDFQLQFDVTSDAGSACP